MKWFKLISVSIILCFFFAASTGVLATPESIHVDDVLEHSQEAILALGDISADVEIVQIQDRREVTIKARFIASSLHRVARVEIREPSALRGQILVVDQVNSEVRMYLPITNQIMIRSIADMGEEAGLALDITDFASLFDLSTYEVQIEDILENEDGTTYILKAQGINNSIQYVYFDEASWLPYALHIYDDDVLVGTLELQNIELNKELTQESITELPRAKEIRQ